MPSKLQSDMQVKVYCSLTWVRDPDKAGSPYHFPFHYTCTSLQHPRHLPKPFLMPLQDSTIPHLRVAAMILEILKIHSAQTNALYEMKLNQRWTTTV